MTAHVHVSLRHFIEGCRTICHSERSRAKCIVGPVLLLHYLNEISAGIVKDGHDDVLPLCRLHCKPHTERT